MATFQKFEDIEAWQKARELTKEIYKVSKERAFSKDFGLRDQMRRAGVSVMSNIAEGFERSGTGEFMQFLSIAKGSVGEVKSQLYVAIDQEYLDKKTFNRLYRLASDVSKMTAGLMNYIRNSNIKRHHYCPNVNLAKPHSMATILILQDRLAFFDLKLDFHKGHTSAPKRKEMAYEFWADNIFSTYGLYTDV